MIGVRYKKDLAKKEAFVEKLNFRAFNASTEMNVALEIEAICELAVRKRFTPTLALSSVCLYRLALLPIQCPCKADTAISKKSLIYFQSNILIIFVDKIKDLV